MNIQTCTGRGRLPFACLSALLLFLLMPLSPAWAQNSYAFRLAIGGAVKAPLGIGTDAADNIYVADTGNNRIVKFDSNLDFLGKIGSTGSGNGQFSNPSGVAVDGSGNIYVADSSNNRIQKFDGEGNFLWTVGAYGTGNEQFQHPIGIAVDSSGYVYVADSGNYRIQKIDPSGAYVGQFGSKGTGNSQFSNPTGVAVDGSGNIYVSDAGNNAVKKFNSAGTWIWTGTTYISNPQAVVVDSSGNVDVSSKCYDYIVQYDSNGNYLRAIGGGGYGNGQFSDPYGVVVDSAGDMFVTDTSGYYGNNRIQILDSQGHYLWQFGSGGSVNGQFNDPTGVGVDSAGNIFVTDAGNYRFQKFDATGMFVFAKGSQGPNPGYFSDPAGIAVDSAGYVYIADALGYYANNCIWKYDNQGNYVGKLGSGGSGNGQFSNPTGVAVDGNGNIYVADNNNNRIQKFNASGTFVWTNGSQGSGNGQFQHPSDVAVDSSGNIYVADSSNSRIQKFDANFTFKWAVGSYGSGAGQFKAPTGLAVDGNGNVYVADNNNNRIQIFDTNGNYLTQLTADVWGDGFASQLSSIAVDAAGSVYITDITNNRVVVLDTMANPVPILTGISPDQVSPGSGNTQITLSGTNFVSGSQVQFGNSQLTTTYVSATQLTAIIPSAFLTTAGVVNVNVTSPTPGGGASNTMAFVIGNNPVPTVTGLSPNRVLAGSGAIPLTVSGTGFVNGAIIYFGGRPVTTTYVSSTELTTTLSASQLAAGGRFGVHVNNPRPYGGNSNSLTFTVANPTPALTGVNPAQVLAGSGNTQITLTGSGFIAKSKAQFKGAALTTTYVSSTLLTAIIPASKLTAPGDFDVTVNNPTPGGGTSTSFTFSVLSPVPTLTSISPNQAAVGSSAIIMTVNGTNFVKGAVVSFGGSALTTTFVSSTQLTATIPSSLLTSTGSFDVVVTNPAPGGGDTSPLTFTVH